MIPGVFMVHPGRGLLIEAKISLATGLGALKIGVESHKTVLNRQDSRRDCLPQS